MLRFDAKGVKVENKFNKNLTFELIPGRIKGSEARAA